MDACADSEGHVHIYSLMQALGFAAALPSGKLARQRSGHNGT